MFLAERLPGTHNGRDPLIILQEPFRVESLLNGSLSELIKEGAPQGIVYGDSKLLGVPLRDFARISWFTSRVLLESV